MIKPHQNIPICLISQDKAFLAQLSTYCLFFGFHATSFHSIEEWEQALGPEPFQLLLLEGRNLTEAELTRIRKKSEFNALILFSEEGKSPHVKLVDHCLCPKFKTEQLQIALIKWSHQILSERKLLEALTKKAPLINPEPLSNLMDYHVELAASIMESFQKEGKQIIDQFKGEPIHNSNEMAMIAHRLKGMAANVGATALAEICFQIEFFCKEKREGRANRYQGQLENIFNFTNQLLDEIIASRQ